MAAAPEIEGTEDALLADATEAVAEDAISAEASEADIVASEGANEADLTESTSVSSDRISEGAGKTEETTTPNYNSRVLRRMQEDPGPHG